MAEPLAIAVDPSDAIGHVRHKLAVAHVCERQLVARRNVGHKGLSKGAQDICKFLRVSINTQGIYKLPRPKLRSYKYLEHLAVHEVELDVHALHVKEATKWSAARAMHEPRAKRHTRARSFLCLPKLSRSLQLLPKISRSLQL